MTRFPPAALRCDVEGCTNEIAVQIGGEQRCITYAIARANELRAKANLPPICFDEEGGSHVVQ